MTDPRQTSQRVDDLPKARITRNWKTYLFWLAPLAAAALAMYFIWFEVVKKGPTITVYFADAAGLQPGNARLKYRGVEIGTVENVKLSDDARRTEVEISLNESGEVVAKEGSRFWIVQPQVGFGGIRGLQTIVSGNYITVQPGKGKEKTKFQGLAQPPAPENEEQGLRIILVLERMGSMKKHSPVMYRGVQVGEVWDSVLGPDSQVVHLLVNIDRNYAPLVRMNSKFWNAGGINFNLGLSGLDVSAQSATALLTGGIDFATPDKPGEPAIQDTAFVLYEKPENAWLSWAPNIKLPHAQSAEPASQPLGD